MIYGAAHSTVRDKDAAPCCRCHNTHDGAQLRIVFALRHAYIDTRMHNAHAMCLG
jgi:hypothetical protein